MPVAERANPVGSIQYQYQYQPWKGGGDISTARGYLTPTTTTAQVQPAMPSLFERLGRTLARKKSEDTPSKSLERPSSTSTELDGKYESISAAEARAAPIEDFPIQEKPKPFQKRLSRAKSPSARPVPTPRVPVLSLHLPELNDAAVAKGLRLTFDATEVDSVLTPAAIARHRLTPGEAVYLAKQSSGALHGKGMHQ